MHPVPTLTQPAKYTVRFSGRANNGWSDYMRGLQENVSYRDGFPVTELTGTVPDQSALFGLLCHLRDLSLSLISVEFIENVEGE